jgi:hypothetical protein
VHSAAPAVLVVAIETTPQEETNAVRDHILSKHAA